MTATTGNKDYDAGWALRWMTAPGKATRITTTRMADNSRQKGGVSGSAENRASNGGGGGGGGSSRSGGTGNGEGRQQSTKSATKMVATAIEVGKRQQARGERQRRRRGQRWG